VIQFLCAHCGKKLAVDESKAGKVARCPVCQQTFRIPTPDPLAEEPPVQEAYREPPPVHRPAPSVGRFRSEREEYDESLQEEEWERRPRRRRKKRRRRSQGGGMPLGMSPLALVLLIGGGIALLSLFASFFVPVLAIIPMGLGYAMMAAGGIWFLVVAFQDEVMHGVLCLFCGFYQLYYLISNFENEKWPFALQMAGLVLVIGGSLAAGIGLKP
jgi:hypothetical protein